MDLIRRSQTGDADAFAALYQQYKNLVYKTAYLMLNSPEEAEDALQEVFLQVHRSLLSYQPEKAAFTTWLYRVTVNHCLNRRRKRRLAILPLTERSSPASASIETHVMNRKDMAQALSGLSEKLRAVLVLRYYWDLPYGDIAQILEIPVGTVKSRLDLALRTLRAELVTESAPPFTPAPEGKVAK